MECLATKESSPNEESVAIKHEILQFHFPVLLIIMTIPNTTWPFHLKRLNYHLEMLDDMTWHYNFHVTTWN